jgi:heme/copper-type cytochrome/quinol oxidase subunit 1
MALDDFRELVDCIALAQALIGEPAKREWGMYPPLSPEGESDVIVAQARLGEAVAVMAMGAGWISTAHSSVATSNTASTCSVVMSGSRRAICCASCRFCTPVPLSLYA